MSAYIVVNDGRPVAKVEDKKMYFGIKKQEGKKHVSAASLLPKPKVKSKKKTLADVEDILEEEDEKDWLGSVMRMKGQDNSLKKLVVSHDKLSYVPNMETREALYIAGPAGSGKSYFAAAYANKYVKLTGNCVYLFSTKDEDKVLDEIPNLKRVPINEQWAELEVDYNIFANSLCIFDDVDSLANKKKIATAVWGLRDTLLQNARSNNTYVISTIHNAFGNRPTITSLQEAHLVVFFPNNGSDHHFRKYLKERAGLDPEMISWIMALESRWVGFYTHAPRFVIWEHGLRVL
jgi:hypothetical protein